MQSHSTSHLGPWIQLQQPPAEVVAGVKVFQLEENAHRAAQAKRHVHRLQVAVREVGRQLRHTLGVVPDLLSLELYPKGNVVLPAGDHSQSSLPSIGTANFVLPADEHSESAPSADADNDAPEHSESVLPSLDSSPALS